MLGKAGEGTLKVGVNVAATVIPKLISACAEAESKFIMEEGKELMSGRRSKDSDGLILNNLFRCLPDTVDPHGPR